MRARGAGGPRGAVRERRREPLSSAAPRGVVPPRELRPVVTFAGDEVALLAEALRENLQEAEKFVKRLERERGGCETPLSAFVKKRCQQTRALLRRLAPEGTRG